MIGIQSRLGADIRRWRNIPISLRMPGPEIPESSCRVQTTEFWQDLWRRQRFDVKIPSCEFQLRDLATPGG